MSDYDVYAVKKDDDGDITHCYVGRDIFEPFYDEAEAKSYVAKHCKKIKSDEVILDIDNKKITVFTFYLEQNFNLKSSKRYSFKLGEKIDPPAGKYLRTIANNKKKDNLDNILEID